MKSKTSPKYALSIRQPWAWLVVNGYKDVENRSWKFSDKFLGNIIFVHAGKMRVSPGKLREFIEICKEHRIKNYPKKSEDFVYGAIIGHVKLVGCVDDSESDWADYGSFHWEIAEAKKIKPVPYIGELKLFKVKL